MAPRQKKADPAPADPAPEIDWELTEMLNEGIDSFEKEGAMSWSEVRRYLDESARRRAAERAKRKGKR
jgi:hypothetical protein